MEIKREQLGKYSVWTVAGGYAFSADSLLLARFSALKERERVADICAGNGVVGYAAAETEAPQVLDFYELNPTACILLERAVMPLYFSLENNTVDYIAEHWRGYKITPKAANIFFIFYRNKEGKVLVRPQMNERDVEMPIESDTPHFYEWEKVKELAYARLAEIDELKKGAF